MHRTPCSPRAAQQRAWPGPAPAAGFAIWRRLLLAPLLLALAACGGGEGVAEVKAEPYRLSYSTDTLRATQVAGGTGQTLQLGLSLDRVVSESVNVAVVDAEGVLLPSITLAAQDATHYLATLHTAPGLAEGVHRGRLMVKLCRDLPTVCQRPLPGSPWPLPYEITVNAAPPPAVVSPASLSLSNYLDETAVVQLSATLADDTPVYPRWVDPSGVLAPNPPATQQGRQLSATLSLAPGVAAGSYQGTLELRLCADAFCNGQLRGSPVRVPYALSLQPATNLTALSPLPGVADWAQHQANAAHTGYVPVTLDASRFNRRWKWRVPNPQANGGAQLQPVVSSSGAVLAVLSGYFAPSSLLSLGEHDGALRWRHDFGSVFAVNPPATDGSQVFVASSGHGDTAMWGFALADGAQRFRTPFSAQWEHYLAPTVAGEAVYTNGGSYGGLYSFARQGGAQNWFTALAQYDQWTPAFGDGQLYAFLPNGLNTFSLATGAVQSVINDPANAVQPYSVFGAPLAAGNRQVIMVNGVVQAGGSNRLISFDTAARSIRWSVPGSFVQAPALAAGVVYAVNGRQLEARSAADGTLLWAWTPDETTSNPFSHSAGGTLRNVIATDNLVFVSSDTRTYAVSQASHQQVWWFAASGPLALSANGVLYIASSAATQAEVAITAINLR